MTHCYSMKWHCIRAILFALSCTILTIKAEGFVDIRMNHAQWEFYRSAAASQKQQPLPPFFAPESNQQNLFDIVESRTLQSSVVCLSNQYVTAASKCADCNAACATCVSPSGSCEKCVYTLPAVNYAQVNTSNLAVCGANAQQCIYRDPFCMGDCGSSSNGGKCQTCLKGTAITSIKDPATNLNVYSCLKCQVQYCTHCFLNSTASGDLQTCLECERYFTLVSDSSTGTLVQRCVRSTTYCPPYCVCDYSGSMNCTRCNDTAYVLVKETGISDFTRCIKSDAANPNLDCGDNCAVCNSLTGACMQCNEGYQPWYDASLLTPQSKFICKLPCGNGCLNCNTATRSCAQCDTANNYTLFLRDQNTKTYRCQSITNMCDSYCTNCDISGLQLYPPVLTGNCLECRLGYYVTSAAVCNKCPSLCSNCAKTSGSCSACTSLKYQLYADKASSINLCTDKVCSTACTSCFIEEGMNSIYKRPICRKCKQGYYVTADLDCQLCPLNCGSCDDTTGKCNQCKPGFSLYTSGATTRCISDSTVGVCQVPHCSTCDSQSNTTCVICDPGFALDINNACPCAITLTFKGQYFTQDWQQIVITWNGKVTPAASIDPTLEITFCTQLLSISTLTALDQANQQHSCFLKYDISTKKSTFIIQLSPTWTIPLDANNNPTLAVSMNLLQLLTPECNAVLDPTQFTAITFTGGSIQAPTVIISRTIQQVPFCQDSVRISSGLTTNTFGRHATFVWSVNSILPAEQSNTKQNKLLTLLNADTSKSDITLDSTTITMLQGKTIVLKLEVTNFLGLKGTATVDFSFSTNEGLYLLDVMESYTINPQNDFSFRPVISLSNCNFTTTSILRIQRLKIQCSIEIQDPITTQYSSVAMIEDCTIPSGMMILGNVYRVKIVGYDPLKEYPTNAVKYSSIKLVKPPIVAKIIGGDQTIDSNNDLTLSVRGENLSKDLSYKWSCKDPMTGLQCVDLYGKYLFLQGTESVFIKRNILTLGAQYQILFVAADQMDVSRVATDYITINTLPKSAVLLQVSLYSDANMNNNQLNVFEKQKFKATVLNYASNPIRDISPFLFTWTVKDSSDNLFTAFKANKTTLSIDQFLLNQNNFYTVCVSVTQSATKESGLSCGKFKTYGMSNLFNFNVNPSVGNAFQTPFVFTVQNTQSLTQQYYYEFGYLFLTLDASNNPTDETFIPFEVSSPFMTKTFKLQTAQPGQSNVITVYAKVTSEVGERYIYFQDVTVNLPAQNATWVGDTITSMNFNSMNEVFNKVSQVTLVANSIETKYKAQVIRTLVSAISNITNSTLGIKDSQTNVQGRNLQAGLGIGSKQDDSPKQRLTIARALSQVSILIRDDPEIISIKEKVQLKNLLQTLIQIDDNVNNFYSTGGDEIMAAGALQTQANKLSNPILQNVGEKSNKNLSTDSSQTPITTNAVTVKDEGASQKQFVEQYSSELTVELLKICDDIYRGESVSNKTDPELKSMAYVGFKKVIAGANNEITNTFSFSSINVQVASTVHVTGISSPANKVVSLQDPLYSNQVQIAMPNVDLCKKNTCQMNVMVIKDPPIKQGASGKIVGSTISINFQKSTTLNQNTILVEQIKVQNLSDPITFTMKLNIANMNSSAGKRCVYFDSKQSIVSDQGIITKYDPTTGIIQCFTYHLTDFSIEEYEQQSTKSKMPENLHRVNVFKPLDIIDTTPVSLIIILSVLTAVLIPMSLILDRLGANKLSEQEQAENKPKYLVEVLFFNKWEERNRSANQVQTLNQTEAEHLEHVQIDDSAEESDSDDDIEVRAWKKKKREEKAAFMKEKERLAKARGTYPLYLMLLLAIRHRIVQLFFAYDKGLSRLSRSFIIISSLFLNLAVTGLYCQDSSSVMTSVVIAILLQKVKLVGLNLLMVKKPKRKIHKFDPDMSLHGNKEKKEKQKEEIHMSYKMSPRDKVSLALGYFIIFSIIAGTIFYSLLQSQRIDEDSNTRWLGNFVLLLFFDFLLFEFVAIFVSTVLLKKVGSHPAALGKLRNYYLKFGPRLIKDAVVEKAIDPEEEKRKAAEAEQKNKQAANRKRRALSQIPDLSVIQEIDLSAEERKQEASARGKKKKGKKRVINAD